MKTISMTPEQILSRVSRFKDLKPLPIQQDPGIPLQAKDLVYARKLLSVIGLEKSAETPINANARVTGAAGMTMTLAVCPPGTGPSLHAHQQTFETFTILKGRFEFCINDDGSEKVVLDELDTISVPPKVNRCFRCVSESDGILQVVITGGVHDMKDIDFAPSVGEKLNSFGTEVRKKFGDRGLTFNAHANSSD